MKKVSVILMMMGFVLPSWAQLGYRTLWEKTIDEKRPLTFPAHTQSYSQTPGGNLFVSYLYTACLKCSTAVATRTISLAGDLKMRKDSTTRCCSPIFYPKFSEIRLTNEYISSDKEITRVFDSDGNLRTTVNGKRINQIISTPSGGFALSSIDTLFHFNPQNQLIKKIPLVKSQIFGVNYTNSEAADPFYLWNDGFVYISRKSFFDKYDYMTSPNIPKENTIIKINAKGETEWESLLKNEKGISKIVGLNIDNQLVVFSDEDSTGRFILFDNSGQKVREVTVKGQSYRYYFVTADKGYLTYGTNQSNNSFQKYDSTGQKKWTYEYYLSPTERNNPIKTFSNGRTLIRDNYLSLLSKNGELMIKSTSWLESAKGYFYLTVDSTLYAINPVGEIAWSLTEKCNHTKVYESKDGFTYVGSSTKMYAVNPQGKVAWTVSGNHFNSFFSEDTDNSLLVRQAIVRNNSSSGLLNKYRFSLQKYNLLGKLQWQMSLSAAPDTTDNIYSEYVFLGGAVPALDGGYVFPKWTFTVVPTTFVDNKFSLVKISRPCYEKLDATLKSATSTLCEGQKLQLTSNTDTLNLLSYQWQRDGQVLSTTRASVFEATAAGAYQVTVRDSVCGTSFVSNTVNVVTRSIQTPSVTSSGSTDFCAGSDFTTLTATSVHPDLRYQWLRNGQVLSGTFQNSLKATEAGSYQLSAFDMVCNATVLSSDIVVKVRPLPEAIVTPEISGAVYAPFKAKLRANEGAGLTYQWLKEGVELTGATSSVYEAGESGNYTVRVSREGCSQLSQTVGITILQPLGVETTVKEEFQVFPNPSRGDFELRLPTGWEKAEIQLIDIIGRSLPLNLTGMQVRVKAVAGMYWLRIKLAEKELSKRVVIVPF